jgi:hypothetical protein
MIQAQSFVARKNARLTVMERYRNTTEKLVNARGDARFRAADFRTLRKTTPAAPRGAAGALGRSPACVQRAPA